MAKKFQNNVYSSTEPQPTPSGEIDSIDNRLPESNARIGILEDNEVETATDIPGSRELREAGQADGGGSGDAPCA